MRMSYAIETAAQFNHATTKKIRRGFARYLLAELRAMHTELESLHREAWQDDFGELDPAPAVDTPEQREALIRSRRQQPTNREEKPRYG